MGIHALIPVQEALHVDHIADLEILHCGINIRGVIAQIGLNGEGVGFAVIGSVEVQIIAVRTGTVPVVQKSDIVSALILTGSFHSQSLEFNELILMIDQLVSAKHGGYIQRLCDEGISAFHEFKGAVHDFHFSGPFGFVSGDADFGSGNEIGCILFRAGQIIEEISAVFILCINGDGVLPPGLGCLYIGFYGNLGVKLCSHILIIAQNCSGSSRSFFGSGFGFRSFRAFGGLNSRTFNGCGAFRSGLCGGFSGSAAACAANQGKSHDEGHG